MPPEGNPQVDPRPAGGKAWVLWLIALLLMGIWLVRGSQSSVATVDYSEFKRRLQAGEITQVELTKDRVLATDKKGGHFGTVRVDDPDLVGELEERHVPYRGRAESDWGSVASLLLFFVAPIAVMWFLFSRRMRPGAGIMAIGKTRARLVAEEGTGVTFKDVGGGDEAVRERRGSR